PARLKRHARFGNLVDVDRWIERTYRPVLARADRPAHVAPGAAREHELVHRGFGLEDEYLVDALLADTGARSCPRAQHERRLLRGVVEQHALAFLADEQDRVDRGDVEDGVARHFLDDRARLGLNLVELLQTVCGELQPRLAFGFLFRG